MDKLTGLLLILIIFIICIITVIKSSTYIIHFTNKQLINEDIKI